MFFKKKIFRNLYHQFYYILLPLGISCYFLTHHVTSWYLLLLLDTSCYLLIPLVTSWYIMLHLCTSFYILKIKICFLKKHIFRNLYHQFLYLLIPLDTSLIHLGTSCYFLISLDTSCNLLVLHVTYWYLMLHLENKNMFF